MFKSIITPACLILCLFFYSLLQAQPALDWHRSLDYYSSPDFVSLHCDGDFVYGIYKVPSYTYLVKANSVGTLIWVRQIQNAKLVRGDGKGGILVAGSGTLSGTSLYGHLLHRLDADGNFIWNRVYAPNSGIQSLKDMELCQDGGILLAAYTLSSPDSSQLIRTDSLGNLLWDKRYSAGSAYLVIEDMHELPNGNILVAAQQGPLAYIYQGAGFGHAMLLDPNGNVLWDRKVGDGLEGLGGCTQLADGSYLFAGVYGSYVGSPQAIAPGLLLTNFDASGNLNWSKTVPGAQIVNPGAGQVDQMGLSALPDSGFAVPWVYRKTNPNGSQALVSFFTKNAGSAYHKKMVKAFPYFTSFFLSDATPTPAGGILMSARSSGTGGSRAVMSHLTPNPNFACEMDTLSILDSIPTIVAGSLGIASGMQSGSGTYSSQPFWFNETIYCSECLPLISSSFEMNKGGLSVFCQDTSTNISAWEWDFGDGSTATGWYANHTYANPGTYTICMKAIGPCNSDSSCQTVSIANCGSPSANFVYSSNGTTVTFTNSSSGGTHYFWDFGDGNVSTSQNPVHAYAVNSSYTACLITYDTCGTDTLCKVIPCFNPNPGFSVFNIGGDSIQIIDQSTGADSVVYTFGDGSSSNANSPIHGYANTGFFTGCQYVYSACSTASVCKTVFVKDTASGNPWACQFQGFGAPYSYLLEPDGNITFAYSSSVSQYVGRVVIGRMDPVGNILWTKRRNVDLLVGDPFSLTRLADGGYLVSTSVDDTAKKFISPFFIKFDSQADFVWARGQIGAQETIPRGVIALPDSGFIITGAVDFNGLLVRCDAQANVVWKKQWTGGGNNGFSDLALTSDGNFIVVGKGVFSTSTPNSKAFLGKFDLNGNPIWTRTIPSSGFYIQTADQYSKVRQCPDGGYILLLDQQWGNQKFELVKTDSLGVVQWVKQFSSSLTSAAHSIEIIPGGKILIAGISGQVIFAMRLDLNGNLEWAKDYDPVYSLGVYGGLGLLPLANGDIFLGGLNKYYWRVDSLGGLGCSEVVFNPPFTNAADSSTQVVPVTGNPIFTLVPKNTIPNPENLSRILVCNPVCIPPHASFLLNSNGLQILIAESSTGTPLNYYWDFGDGNTASVPVASHTYASPGTYSVCLILSNSCGADTLCQAITISCLAISASFGHSTSLLTATFANSSTGSNLNYAWDFGDGSGSTAQNPIHTYGASGNYQVCLIIYDSCSADTTCQVISVSCPPISAGFQVNDSLTLVSFVDQSVGADLAYFWDFGDGDTSSQSNPQHTYAGSGTYQVCLIISDGCSSDTSCQSIKVVCPVPVADFSSNVTMLNVAFFNAGTTGAIYSWDFGDGTNSSLENPTHSYPGPGSYQVCLITTNVCGADTFCESVSVSCPAPAPAFSFTQNGLAFAFTNQTPGNPSFQWDFGDGNISTQVSPTHTFAAAGAYTVCLTATDSCGSDSLCQNLLITGLASALPGGILLYPNPAQNRVRLKWESGGMPEVGFSDVRGRILFLPNRLIADRELEFDLESLASGLYLLQIMKEGRFTTLHLQVLR